MWSSSNPCVANVNINSGRIYANKVGTAVITAITRDGNYRSYSIVNVDETFK
ncbi:MAG: Ig-like domain-containing protein [Acutalibacteraceae bacterium]